MLVDQSFEDFAEVRLDPVLFLNEIENEVSQREHHIKSILNYSNDRASILLGRAINVNDEASFEYLTKNFYYPVMKSSLS